MPPLSSSSLSNAACPESLNRSIMEILLRALYIELLQVTTNRKAFHTYIRMLFVDIWRRKLGV